MSETHECVFVEEQEPSGRLILPPCLICGTTAMDALVGLREDIQVALDNAIDPASWGVVSHLQKYAEPS